MVYCNCCEKERTNYEEKDLSTCIECGDKYAPCCDSGTDDVCIHCAEEEDMEDDEEEGDDMEEEYFDEEDEDDDEDEELPLII